MQYPSQIPKEKVSPEIPEKGGGEGEARWDEKTSKRAIYNMNFINMTIYDQYLGNEVHEKNYVFFFLDTRIFIYT